VLRRRRPHGSFRCAVCGGEHEGVPRAYAVGAEPPGWDVTREPASRRWGEVHDEQAVLYSPTGPEGFFVRGNVEIPVLDDHGSLVLTVWVSLSKTSFVRAADLWDDRRRVGEPPYFGWLNSDIPTYPAVRNMKTNVHSREPGLRPLVELEPTDHPLAVDQRQGVRPDKLFEIASRVLHANG
jgi:hypothetical protein